MATYNQIPSSSKLLDICAPEIVAESPLYKRGDYLVVSNLLGGDTLERLAAEADQVRNQSERMVVSPEKAHIEERGGTPRRAFRHAHGRELHWKVYGASDLARQISGLCGATLTPTGAGSYSFYEESGDFLDLHRDILSCDVAVITCLKNTCEESAAGSLLVYPAHRDKPLSFVRNCGRQSSTRIPLGRGETIILMGGLVPHEVTPMVAGQQRIASLMCYRMT